MNSINNTINGLASSLFLNVGLTSVAEKFDPMQDRSSTSHDAMTPIQSCEPCTPVCNFAPEAGQ